MALLGWSPVDNQEIFSLEELVKVFDYHHMSKSPAVFDTVKLRWMNGEYLKAMDFDKFYEMAEPYIRQVITKDYDLKKIAAMVKTRIEVFPDIADHIDFFEAVPEYDISMYCSQENEDKPENLPLRSCRRSFRYWKHWMITPMMQSMHAFRDFVAEKGYKNGLMYYGRSVQRFPANR